MTDDPTVIQYWDELTDEERKERFRWLYDEKAAYQEAFRVLYRAVDEIRTSFVEPHGHGFRCSECGATNDVREMLIHTDYCTASLLCTAMVRSGALTPND